jgi:hypothetical protein
LFLAFSIQYLHSAQWQLELVQSNNILDYEIEQIEHLKESAYALLRNGLLFLAGSLCTLALYALIALKEFKIFQPFVERQKEKRNARKSERLARKEAKTQADKQKRIEELQAELDELKDKTNSNP